VTNVYNIVVGRPKLKRLARPRHKREDILKWILGKQVVDWIDVAHDRDWWPSLMNMGMNLRVP
jgi:hypothetical protein